MTVSTSPTTENAGNAVIKGLKLEAQWLLGPYLSFT
jgi:hypothetical protein